MEHNRRVHSLVYDDYSLYNNDTMRRKGRIWFV